MEKRWGGDGGYENPFLFWWQLLFFQFFFVFYVFSLLLSLIVRECWVVSEDVRLLWDMVGATVQYLHSLWSITYDNGFNSGAGGPSNLVDGEYLKFENFNLDFIYFSYFNSFTMVLSLFYCIYPVHFQLILYFS